MKVDDNIKLKARLVLGKKKTLMFGSCSAICKYSNRKLWQSRTFDFVCSENVNIGGIQLPHLNAKSTSDPQTLRKQLKQKHLFPNPDLRLNINAGVTGTAPSGTALVTPVTRDGEEDPPPNNTAA